MPELLSAVADVAWPLIVLLGLLLLYRPVARLLRSGSEREEVTIEVGGQRLSLGKFREQQNETVLDLRRQIDDLRRHITGAPPAAPAGSGPSRASVLWVDDRPENNALLIDQLMGVGVRVDTARTTAEGLAMAARKDYGAVITDMGRDEDGQHLPLAGLDLVRQLRAAGVRTPVLMFTSSRAVRQHGEEARAAGAQAITSSAVDLVAFLRANGVME
jgi:CheY-like chemotaxis protein